LDAIIRIFEDTGNFFEEIIKKILEVIGGLI